MSELDTQQDLEAQMDNNPRQEIESQPVSGKIFYATHYTKTTGIRWPVPRGGPLSFYTTWNAIAAAGITLLAILTIPWLRIWPITQKIAAFTIVPISNATIASIFCTAIVSQLLFSFNIHVERPLDEPEEDKKKSLCVSIDFIQSMLAYNFIYHLGPLLGAVLLAVAVAFIPGPTTLLGRSVVFLISLLMFTIFVVAWLSTPTKIGISQLDSFENTEGEQEADEAVTGIEKIERIYRNPPMWYMSVVFPSIAILTLLFSSFALYGACSSVGIQEF